MNGWLYFGFTAVLFVIFIGIVVHYYNPRKKEKIEDPKYRMLDEDKK